MFFFDGGGVIAFFKDINKYIIFLSSLQLKAIFYARLIKAKASIVIPNRRPTILIRLFVSRDFL